MSGRNFGNWISAYLEYTRYSESPLAFHFWTAVGTIAGALRRRVWIDQHYFQWTPNFYIIFVAPPGIAGKSTSVAIGMNLLKEVPGIHFGPQSITWQALTQALSDSTEYMYMSDNPDPLLDEGYPMSCITCSIGELGTFLNPADKEMVDVLTSLWDGQLGTWKRATKTQGTDEIVNPWVHIVGATTPAWIHEHFTEDLIGGGLASRTLFVYEENKRHLVAYPADLANGVDFTAESQKLIDDLTIISNMRGEYELSPQAKAWGVRWYERHWTKRPKNMASDRFGGYLARKQTHIHKTAIVFAAAASSEMVIQDTHLKMADREVTRLEASMHRVFEKVGESSTNRHVALISNYLQAYGELEYDRLWKNCMTQMTGRDFKYAIAAGVSAGMFVSSAGAGKHTIKLKGASR